MANKGKTLGVFLEVWLSFFYLSFIIPSETSYSGIQNFSTSTLSTEKVVIEPEIIHLKTPEPLKGIYMTQCVAGMPSFREKLVKLIDETELNAVVIDIKDYTGTVAFKTGNEKVDALEGSGCKVPDMQEFVQNLHNRGIYVIGRVTVFQDPLYVKIIPVKQ